MNVAAQTPPEKFLSCVDALFRNISGWLAGRDLSTLRTSVELYEEAYGKYQTDALSIRTQTGTEVALLTPVGASVIGASGRVDLVGTSDRDILVYLEQGGPTISKSVTVNGQVETQTVPLYRGVSEAGWYWVESRKPSRARQLDKALFLDLLEEVSDYENR